MGIDEEVVVLLVGYDREIIADLYQRIRELNHYKVKQDFLIEQKGDLLRQKLLLEKMEV